MHVLCCDVTLSVLLARIHLELILKLQTYGYYLAYYWMNNDTTRNALGIKEVFLFSLKRKEVFLFSLYTRICSCQKTASSKHDSKVNYYNIS
jgi:hypothetical protein